MGSCANKKCFFFNIQRFGCEKKFVKNIQRFGCEKKKFLKISSVLDVTIFFFKNIQRFGWDPLFWGEFYEVFVWCGFSS